MSDNETYSNRENKKQSRKNRESIYTHSSARKYIDRTIKLQSIREEKIK